MKAVNSNNNMMLADKVIPAKTFFTRLKGLMFKQCLNDGEGLLLEPCNSIHSLFMRFSIDAVFISRENRVIHIIEDMKPWRCSAIIGKAAAVLELPAGTIAKTGIRKGDILNISSGKNW